MLILCSQMNQDHLCSWTELVFQVSVFLLHPFADLSDIHKCCELLILEYCWL